MFELQTLGPVGLRQREVDGGVSVATIVQPKRLGLLAFLVLAPRRRFRRRDQLVAMLWPDLDGEHARGSLSQALRHIRDVIGEILITQGEDEVGVDQSALWCDASALAAAHEARDYQKVLGLYGGPFFDAYLVAGAAPEFQEWVDRERDRLRGLAASAAKNLALDAESRSDLSAAVEWARREAIISPDDEVVTARLIRLLDLSGDRMGALKVYDGLRQRLWREYEAKPSAETEALISRIKAR